ncbi:hypothetical protein GUJ93_ZPchr0008g11462 [Zizania palustris]|uniref:Uncharacterized protein n=1 Tax=Zizania palustris TaxID=103762 RepID=A0A8J5RGL9_ZIZPA|nr:hypothetical protein GUJ93_ZPchr0008g11462 [Zizania palustris]
MDVEKDEECHEEALPLGEFIGEYSGEYTDESGGHPIPGRKNTWRVRVMRMIRWVAGKRGMSQSVRHRGMTQRVWGRGMTQRVRGRGISRRVRVRRKHGDAHVTVAFEDVVAEVRRPRGGRPFQDPPPCRPVASSSSLRSGWRHHRGFAPVYVDELYSRAKTHHVAVHEVSQQQQKATTTAGKLAAHQGPMTFHRII